MPNENAADAGKPTRRSSFQPKSSAGKTGKIEINVQSPKSKERTLQSGNEPFQNTD